MCLGSGIILKTMSKLQVPLAEYKTVGPTGVLVFLGLELDSNKMVVRIPLSNVQDVSQTIKDLISKPITTLKLMQSLIGSLNFCCRAIVR